MLLALVPAPALAHASLVAADPSPGALLAAPPTAVTLRFSETVAVAGPGLTVVAPDGRPAPIGPARADGSRLSAPFHATQEGTYLLRWQVIAADTHPGRGQFTFSIGRQTPPPVGSDLTGDVGAVSPTGLLLQGLARWLHFLGLALGFGVIAFRVLVLPDPGPAQSQKLDRLVGVGVALLLVAEPVTLAAQAASLGVVAGDLLDSSLGRVLGLRLGAALLLWATLGATRAANGERQGRVWPGLLGLGVGLAVLDGAAGHRITGLPDAAAFALGAVHEGAMAIWVGGLAAVLATRTGAARFGRVAVASFTALALTGAGLALSHLTGPADLVSSTYGGVLAVKVVGVGALVVVAGMGTRRLELGVLAGVLAVAGLLTSLPPPR